MPLVSFHTMQFMKLRATGKCPGISFVDDTMIHVRHNLRRCFDKVSKDIAADDRSTMEWCHSFKLHLSCNDCGEIITSCLKRANVSDRDARVRNVFSKELQGKVFADRGHIRRTLFEELFDRDIHPVHGLKADMKNRLMLMWDKVMSYKRYIIECINELLKNKTNPVHSRHRPVYNFMMDICPALTASSTTNPRHCPYISKRQGNLVCSNCREKLSQTRVIK